MKKSAVVFMFIGSLFISSNSWCYAETSDGFKQTEYLATINRTESQYKMGLYYYYGNEVAQNKMEAIKWFKRSAERGGAEAQYMLGLIYLNSENNKKEEESFKWFKLAADNDHTNAQFELGKYYYIAPS
ncbi:sel1 repeat family protein [Bartonella sp. HY329]|uniref:tetratricopeptide repeat protein n=1 Tax=unclassified Bartonella TaxID=2645622 RepID=UPI0021C8BBCA|nr:MULTISPECIES: tetratricopeptide repeat protein [unclassified Bartonella]UXM94103.1 sel1 repeat family protein [Bartonella sp. HY329]UXN08425.1 sel1 repeat family protein [Bartonella sp. HY328]